MKAIERMARALAEYDFDHADMHAPLPDSKAAYADQAWPDYQDRAVVALQAIREPEEGAVMAATDVDRPYDGDFGGKVSLEGYVAGAAWTAMIDHMLADFLSSAQWGDARGQAR